MTVFLYTRNSMASQRCSQVMLPQKSCGLSTLPFSDIWGKIKKIFCIFCFHFRNFYSFYISGHLPGFAMTENKKKLENCLGCWLMGSATTKRCWGEERLAGRQGQAEAGGWTASRQRLAQRFTWWPPHCSQNTASPRKLLCESSATPTPSCRVDPSTHSPSYGLGGGTLPGRATHIQGHKGRQTQQPTQRVTQRFRERMVW